MQKLKCIKNLNCSCNVHSNSNNKINNNTDNDNDNEENDNSMISSNATSHASMTLTATATPTAMTTTTTTTKMLTVKKPEEKCNSNSSRPSRNQHSGAVTAPTTTTKFTTTTIAAKKPATTTAHYCFWPNSTRLLLLSICLSTLLSTTHLVKADEGQPNNRFNRYASTTPINHLTENKLDITTTSLPATATTTTTTTEFTSEDWQPLNKSLPAAAATATAGTTTATHTPMPPIISTRNARAYDSIFMRFARRFSTGNELWDGIIRDCYLQPTFSCFQKNVYGYLSEALEARDVNVTQRLKFYKNQIAFEPTSTTESAMEAELSEDADDNNEIPETGRSESTELPPTTPIEDVTNALYSKSLKFAMTHDLEVRLPEMMFDGATFRISPRSIEGNGIIAKLELIPKQEVEARLAGKIIMKKIQKFLKSKLLLSFLALLIIIKIIKIKLFWLLPIIIGVGAAKKLLLKFLLFLFPALSHLFKLCSYYQQSYHTTKYHHHHHLINHHHTVVPPWHSDEHTVPEIIYTNPPKGHPSAYLHGAPIHESHGSSPGHVHYEGAWENSGPGLGAEYITDINRVAQVDENANYFKPNNANDANELHAWGLATTQSHQKQAQRNPQQQQQQLQQQQQQQHQHQQQLQLQQQQNQQYAQQQRPAAAAQALHKQQQLQQQQQQQQHQHQQNYLKSHASSHSFNPFQNQEKQQSIFQAPTTKLRNPQIAQSAPHPVYTPQQPAQRIATNGNQIGPQAPPPPPSLSSTAAATGNFGGLAAQIVAQYDPTRNTQQQQQQLQQQQQQLSPELAAQLKEAIRIQAEQRIIAQQQKILEHQPFVQDGEPLYPKNYDPFYSPILLKIDKIIEQLGVTDDLCKERLVCSMYKDPTRYSPHSNFISAELSRDTSELEAMTNANANEAVLRFYRLIQAARDGQDQKDCLALYPQCNINTE